MNFVLANPKLRLAGLILSSPFYRFPKTVRIGYFKRMMINFLARNTSVNLTKQEIIMASKISLNSLTKDTKMIESYPADRLSTPFLSLGMVTSLIDITLPLKEERLR